MRKKLQRIVGAGILIISISIIAGFISGVTLTDKIKASICLFGLILVSTFIVLDNQ